jgi:hypothetical protein
MGTSNQNGSESSESLESGALKTTDKKARSAEKKEATEAYREGGDDKWLKEQKTSETKLTGAHEKPFELTDNKPLDVKKPSADLPELLQKLPGMSDKVLFGMDKAHTVFKMQRTEEDTNSDGSTTDHYTGKLNDGMTRLTCTGVNVDVVSKDGQFQSAHIKYSGDIGPVTVADGEGGMVKMVKLREVNIKKNGSGDNYDVTFSPSASVGNRPCNGFSVVEGVMAPTYDASLDKK